MDEKNGYILLARKIKETRFYNRKKLSKYEAWIDLLFKATYDRNGRYWTSQDKKIWLEYGEVVASTRFLQEAWHWKSNATVKHFLDKLENEERQIKRRTEQGETVISIVNYEKYQDPNIYILNIEQHRKENHSRTPSKHQLNKHNKVKKVNKVNEVTSKKSNNDLIEEEQQLANRLKEWNDNQSNPMADFSPEGVIKKHGYDLVYEAIQRHGNEDNGFNRLWRHLKKECRCF